MPEPPDDTALRAGLAAGQEEAFAAVYDRFAPRLLAVAWGLLGSRPDAEDAVQDTFVSLVRSRAALAGAQDLEAYLFAALRHAAARRRRRRPDEAIAQEPAAEDLPPGAALAAAERAARLERALASLPAEQREVVALKIDGGLTLAQVAAVLGTGINTVASRYRYALAKLRDRLKEA